METRKNNLINGLISKLYGGLDMSWKNVILFAVGTAVLTAVVLIVPAFKDTSFQLMGVTFEAWIFFAVIIMANCKKPLESALKTFVFFLISQPLIYLIQVPFSSMGWQILHYYYNWILWTLLTFPMAFAGWFITKKNWLSVLIFAPVFAYLGVMLYGYGAECVKSFPHLLIAALFCLLQLILYVLVFFPDMKQKLVGILMPVIAVIAVTIFSATTQQVELGLTIALPDAPSFSEEATITLDDDSFASVTFWDMEGGIVFIHAQAYGTATITVTDGDETYQYTLDIYNEKGSAQTTITPLGQAGSNGP